MSSDPTKSTAVVDPRTSLAIWLRTGRTQRGLSLGDVARTTKIQLKTLERLEAGTQEGLPAEVFVRGFVRSYARCVGLDEDETLRRYQQCNEPVPPPARAVVEAMAELAPEVAEQMSAPALSQPIVDPTPKPSKKRRRGAKRAKRRLSRIATGTPFAPTQVVEEAELELEPESEVPVAEATPEPVEPAPAPASECEPEPAATEPWQPKMPPLPTATVPWRMSRPTARLARPLVPSLVIDDSDPDSAERVLEARAADEVADEAPRRSLLPPILLDREDRSIRQGGLTLAVILLLIAATLTLSYLMRRPSSSGDGVTQADTPATLIG